MLIKFISISNLWSISRSFHKSPCSFDPSKTYSAMFVVCVALLLPLSLLREYCSCFIKIIFSQSTSTQPLPAYISLPHIDWPLARPIASQTAGMASASSEVWIYKRKTDLKWNWLVFEADSVVDSMVSYFFSWLCLLSRAWFYAYFLKLFLLWIPSSVMNSSYTQVTGCPSSK